MVAPLVNRKWNFTELALELRSGCPINLSVEVLGDRWSLVVLRDMMFDNHRTYGELHGKSLEGIATNILANRLHKLSEAGLVTSAPDPTHKQRSIYSLTEAAIMLVPVMQALGSWGAAKLPASPQLSARAVALARGGAETAEAFMAELRHLHLGAPRPARSVLAELQQAYLAAGGD